MNCAVCSVLFFVLRTHNKSLSVTNTLNKRIPQILQITHIIIAYSIIKNFIEYRFYPIQKGFSKRVNLEKTDLSVFYSVLKRPSKIQLQTKTSNLLT